MIGEKGGHMGNGILSDPAATIVPLLALDESTGVPHFLGTAAFVGAQPMLVTAEHVVRDWSGPFGITTVGNTVGDTNPIIPASLVVKNPSVDLALLEVPDYRCEKPLQLAADGEITANHIVACFEYSTTETRGTTTWLSPATWMKCHPLTLMSAWCGGLTSEPRLGCPSAR